jgi:hypothetical protein
MGVMEEDQGVIPFNLKSGIPRVRPAVLNRRH